MEDEVVVSETDETQTPQVNPEVEKLSRERDRREKEMRLKHEKTLKAAKEENDKLKAQLEELQNASLAGAVKGAAAAATTQPAEADALAVKIEILEKRFQQKEKDYQEQLARERTAREEAERKHKLTERDRLLAEALDGVGVVNKTIGFRYFKDQIVEDEIDGTWMYRTHDGKIVPIKEGVEFELPLELKPSAIKAGGTGVTGATPGGRKTSLQKQLEQIEADLSNLGKQHAQTRGADEHVLARFQQARREKARILEEMKKAK